MKLVPLYGRRGVVRGHAMVDDADYERVMEHRWHLASTGYAEGVDGLLMHRLLLGLRKGDGQYVDHVSGDELDNRRANIRVCSQALNLQNRRGANRGGSSGHRGVSFCKRTGRWTAQVMIDGRNHFLGRHDTKEQAARAAADFRRARMPFAS